MKSDSCRFAFLIAFMALLIHMCTHFNSRREPAQTQDEDTNLPEHRPPMRQRIQTLYDDCVLALSMSGANFSILGKATAAFLSFSTL